MGAQGDWQAGRRRARGLVPRPHAWRARRDRPAGQARGLGAALAGGAVRERLNDAESLAALVGPETAAILIEPVQGEGGIYPATPEFLAAARALADEHGALLIFDEVQCGTGRTGSFFAWEQLGVAPDALVLAKALANGLPIGALLVADGAPEGLAPGDHGSTFGGNPVVCAAACAVVETIDESLLLAVREHGARSPPGSRRSPASSRCAAAA